MKNGTYYLNNSGSKTRHYTNGKPEKVLLYHGINGYCKMRTPLYCYSFGNFAGYAFKYAGKIVRCLPENCNGVIVCFVDYTEKYDGRNLTINNRVTIETEYPEMVGYIDTFKHL